MTDKCRYCFGTRMVTVEIPRGQWIPMKDGIYSQPDGSLHACMRGVEQKIHRPCPVCQDPSDGARWRALIGSNLSWQGSAGFGHGSEPADPSGYRHFGISFTNEPTRETPRSDDLEAIRVRCNAQGRAVLIEFTDAILVSKSRGTANEENATDRQGATAARSG